MTLTPTTTRVDQLADVSIDLEGQTVTDVWRALFDQQPVRDSFIRGLRELAVDRTVPELYDDLEEFGLLEWLWSRVRDVGLGDRREAWRLVGKIVPKIGSDVGSIEDLKTTARVFDADQESATVAINVPASFRDPDEIRRDQRVDVLELIALLANAFDVRLVATRVTQRWLANEHREDLPGVSEWCNTDRDQPPLADVVDEATDALDPDGRDVTVLRTLYEDHAETLSYSQLYGMFPEIDESRIRQCITRLSDLSLVEPFDPQSNRKVELLEAGRKALDVLDAEIGRQAELEGRVSESPNPHDRPCNPAHGMDGKDGEPYQTVYMDRHDHAAAAACGLAGGVTLADGPFNHGETAGTDRVRYVSYDPDRDEAVVAVRATGALQHTVSVATALADPMLIDDALPLDRLDSITLSEAVLRDARCIGALSDEALEDPETLRDALVEWGNDLEDLTTDLKRRNYDDRDEFRSAIMRSAHGLAGSIVHLLDVVGVDIVREVRVPAGLNNNRLTGLTESITKAAAIQSRYGHYAAYRQLFEPRAEKRQQALEVPVDAEDPFGSLIGGIVVRGPGVDRLRPLLEARFGSDEDLVEDAPEFAINVTLREVSREDFATAASRILSPKNLSLTRETISIIHTLAGSPHAAARALQQLGKEDWPRDLRPDEVRFLATLDSRHILPEFAPSVGKIVLTLLERSGPITQSELADRAGVSTQTIRNHRESLKALGLIQIGEDGYRLELSTSDERDVAIVPTLVENGTLLDAVDALLTEHLPPGRYGDPEDPVGGVLFWPPDPWSLQGHDDLASWLELAARLVDADRPTDGSTTIAMGPEIEQQPLPTATGPSEVGA